MLSVLLQKFKNGVNLGDFFYKIEVILLGLIGVGAWLLRPKSPKSNFKVRESDLHRPLSPSKKEGDESFDSLAQARIPRKEFLRLSGIRLDGQPHEILGIPMDSSAERIQQAYRDLMKVYHPDRVGLQGSREWKDSQQIAEAIIRAKEEMLKRTR